MVMEEDFIIVLTIGVRNEYDNLVASIDLSATEDLII